MRFFWMWALGAGAVGVGCGSNNAGGSSDAGSKDVTVSDAAERHDGAEHSSTTSSRSSGTHDSGHTDAPRNNEAGPTADSGKDARTVRDTGASGTVDAGASVLQHHLHASRDGHYVDALMTEAYAKTLKLSTTFNGTIGGPLWGQPLYVENGVGGKGTFYVADDSDDLYAIDETSGMPVWSKVPFVTSAAQTGACGDVQPIGVTGTPVIDLPSRTMFFVAAEGTGSAITTQKIHAVSIDTGDEISSPSGWPIDVTKLTSGDASFAPRPQGQRSALALVNGFLYVPFGGEDGDCCNGSDSCTQSGGGTYHGWVMVVPIASPSHVQAFATPAPGGGIWAVGGMSSDGVDVFATTGNAFGTSSIPWAQAGSEAVLRFHGGASFSGATTDWFAPTNWQNLDEGDTDLGGTGAVVVDVPGATPSALMVALGKSGVMHILNRANLGGIFDGGNGTTGEGLYSNAASTGEIKTAPAVYTTTQGTYVVFHSDGDGASCPNGAGDLIATKITATNPPTFKTAWCAATNGAGAPIVTTSDTTGSNPIVWVVGAEGTNMLYGYEGDTGASVVSLGGMGAVRHFSSPIELKGKIVVGGSSQLYVFSP